MSCTAKRQRVTTLCQNLSSYALIGKRKMKMSKLGSLATYLLAALLHIMVMPQPLSPLIPDLGTWDGSLAPFKPWWLKIKLWTANLKTYLKMDVYQAMAVRMSRVAEGFMMELIKEVGYKGWQSWIDIVDRGGKEVVGLQMIIQWCSTKRDRLEMMLKQIRGFKQGQKNIDKFLLEFENLLLKVVMSPL